MEPALYPYQIIERYASSKNAFYFRATRADNGADTYLRVIPISSFSGANELLSLQLTVQKQSAFRHPSVIPLGLPDVSANGLILNQAYVTGKSLSDTLKDSGRPMALEDAFSTAYTVISALAALHGQSLAHGSLTSNHILITPEEEVFVSFLPLPNDYDSKIKRYRHTGTNAETPNPRDDVFALGVVLTEIFTGLIPYGGSVADSHRNANKYYEYYESGLANLEGFPARDVADLILGCLSPDKKSGLGNAIDVFNRYRVILEQWTNDGNILPAASPRPAPQKKDSKKSFSANPKPAAQPADDPDTKPTVRVPAYQISDYEPRSRRKKIFAGLLTALLTAAVAIGGFFLYRALSRVPLGDRPDYRGTMAVLNVTQTALSERAAILSKGGSDGASGTGANSAPNADTAAMVQPTATSIPAAPIRNDVGAALRWLKDNQEMVFVPGGAFYMGLDGSFGFNLPVLSPMTSVQLNSYWIDRSEISAGQYRRCVESTICAEPKDERFPADDSLPAVGIAWADAEAYCRWAGKRLPSEAEWEKAARGTNGALWPWGNDSPYTQAANEELSAVHSVSAESFDVSPYGALSMGGNVAEWTNDFFTANRVMQDGMENPQGPLSGTTRTVKGGSAADAQVESGWLSANRFGVEGSNPQPYGFRCAISSADINETLAVGLPDAVATAPMSALNTKTAGCTELVGFVADVTADGQTFRQGETMTKTWRFRNVGTCLLNADYQLIATSGLSAGYQRIFRFGTAIAPGGEGEVTISYPAVGVGAHRVDFLVASPSGITFGLGPQQRGALWTEYTVE